MLDIWFVKLNVMLKNIFCTLKWSFVIGVQIVDVQGVSVINIELPHSILFLKK